MHKTARFQPSVLSQISHELRIPLTGIVGMVHFLEKTPLNRQQKTFLAGIAQSAQALLAAEAKICNLLNTQKSH